MPRPARRAAKRRAFYPNWIIGERRATASIRAESLDPEDALRTRQGIRWLAAGDAMNASLSKQEAPALEMASPEKERRMARGLAVLRRHYAWSLGSVFTGLALWEIVSRFIVGSKLFLAAPSQVAVALVHLLLNGELQTNVLVSAIEFVTGYVLAAILGILLGLAMATSRRAKQALQPWVSGLYATPTVALAPLFILWFGIGLWSKIVVVAVLVIFPVAINTEAGLLSTNRNLVETVRSFGANARQVFFKVSLPSALPFIFAGLKLGIGRGLIGVVVGELFGARAGIGQLISQSAETFNMPELFAGVTILAAAGIGLTSSFAWLERRLLPWRD